MMNLWLNKFFQWSTLKLIWWDISNDSVIEMLDLLIPWFLSVHAQWSLIQQLLWFQLLGLDLLTFIHMFQEISVKDIRHWWMRLKIILLLLHNTMECLLSLIVEQLENMLVLWLLKSTTKVEVIIRETFVFAQHQHMEQTQQLHKYVEWKLLQFSVMKMEIWSQQK